MAALALVPGVSAADHTGYGLRQGVLQFIADVPSGLACGCTCARCGQRLIAKKGAIRQHHFAHFEDTACHGAAESALHLLAKELLARCHTFGLPQYTYNRRRKTRAGVIVQHHGTITNGGLLPVHGVRVESRAGDFIPDIIIESDSTSILIEVAVTNRVTRPKLRKIRRRNLPALEIRLEASDSFLPREALQRKLQQASACKAWLFHPDQRAAERAFAAKYRAALAMARRKPAVVPPPFRRRPVMTRSTGQHTGSPPRWQEYERAGNAFHRQHGRYPTLEECRRLWPHLYGKSEP